MPAKKRKHSPTLGIMALYIGQNKRLEERKYFANLINEARRRGLKAYVFTPEDIKGNLLLTHHYEQGKWKQRLDSFPDVIYDRCRYQPTIRFKQLQRFRKKYPKLLYMNRPIANKWGIYQLLKQQSNIAPHLPATAMLNRTDDIMPFIKQHTSVYTKPINGTGGRGVLRIERIKAGKYRIQGRNEQRKILKPRLCSIRTLKSYLSRYVNKGNYMIQQGIDITLMKNRVHDYRVLVQKDSQGEWKLTGGAARIGKAGSVTSNLHGGGSAIAMESLLEKRYGNIKTEKIMQEVEEISISIAYVLEKRYKALCELALDLAIDPQGHIWLLETNPKPSREVFARIGKLSTYQTAIQRPIEYALFLLSQHMPVRKDRSL